MTLTVEEIHAEILKSAARLARGCQSLLDVGATGEAIIEALHPEWKRAPRGTRGYDFIDSEGARVQAKTHGQGVRRNFDNIDLTCVDRVIILQLTDDGWEVLCDCAAAPLAAETSYRNRKGMLPVFRRMHRIEEFGMIRIAITATA